MTIAGQFPTAWPASVSRRRNNSAPHLTRCWRRRRAIFARLNPTRSYTSRCCGCVIIMAARYIGEQFRQWSSGVNRWRIMAAKWTHGEPGPAFLAVVGASRIDACEQFIANWTYAEMTAITYAWYEVWDDLRHGWRQDDDVPLAQCRMTRRSREIDSGNITGSRKGRRRAN